MCTVESRSTVFFDCVRIPKWGRGFSNSYPRILQRTNKGGIGFGADISLKVQDSDALQKAIHSVETQDLTKYGLIPEFVGRLPVIATLDELGESALIDILNKPKNSLVKQYKKLFKMENVEIDFTEEALELVAKKALQRKSGARGLRSILEKILLNTMYDLPSISNVSKVLINSSVIEELSEPILIYADQGKSINNIDPIETHISDKTKVC